VPDFPRPATAAEVWAYGTRELTGITGTPRTNLIGADQSLDAHGYTTVRAGRLDNLDVLVSTRSSHSAADVWAVATRTITTFTGTPRTDLMGEDASFEAGVGTRKTRIDRLANIEAFDTPIEGTLVADGTEQNVVLDEVTGNPSRFLEGYIDFNAMVAGDTVVIRQYVSVVTPVAYRQYATETYSGAQAMPMIFVVSKSGRYGIRVTLQQTAGTYKSFPYQFFRRRIA